MRNDIDLSFQGKIYMYGDQLDRNIKVKWKIERTMNVTLE